MKVNIKVDAVTFEIGLQLENMPGLCSGLIAYDIRCWQACEYQQLTAAKRRGLYRRLHEAIIEASCDFEAHYLVCSHNAYHNSVGFNGLAETMGYDELQAYTSRVTENTCRVYGYNITREEKTTHGDDLTDCYGEDDDEEDYYD